MLIMKDPTETEMQNSNGSVAFDFIMYKCKVVSSATCVDSNHATSLAQDFCMKCLQQATKVVDHVSVYILMLSFYMIFLLDFGTVSTVLYFFYFSGYSYKQREKHVKQKITIYSIYVSMLFLICLYFVTLYVIITTYTILLIKSSNAHQPC